MFSSTSKLARISRETFTHRIESILKKLSVETTRWERHVLPNLQLLNTEENDGIFTAKFKLNVQEKMCHEFGTPHGGFLMTLIDDSTSVTTMAADPHNRMITTTDMSASFLGAAKMGSDLIITSVVEKTGRSMGFATAHIADSNGKRICLGRHSMMFIGEEGSAINSREPNPSNGK